MRRYHVFSLLEDRQGNIWFGTIGAGVYRYDGKTFTNFTTQHGLPDDKIGCFYEDRNGSLWIGTINGLSRYDGLTFTNYGTEDGLDRRRHQLDRQGQSRKTVDRHPRPGLHVRR